MISYYDRPSTEIKIVNGVAQFIFFTVLLIGDLNNSFSQSAADFPKNTQLPKRVSQSDSVGLLFNDGPRTIYLQDSGSDPIEILFWDRELKLQKAKAINPDSGINTVDSVPNPQKDNSASIQKQGEPKPDFGNNSTHSESKYSNVKPDNAANQNSVGSDAIGSTNGSVNERLIQTPNLQPQISQSSDPMSISGVAINEAAGLKLNNAKWPVQVKPKNIYGRLDPQGQPYRGLIFDVPVNTPVTAIGPGRVMFSDYFKSYGNLIIVSHGDRVVSVYANNQKLIKKEGDLVNRGEVIALSGEAGAFNYPALYFEIRKDGRPIDPAQFL